MNEGIRTGLAFLDESLSESVVHDKVKVNALGKVTCHCQAVFDDVETVVWHLPMQTDRVGRLKLHLTTAVAVRCVSVKPEVNHEILTLHFQ